MNQQTVLTAIRNGAPVRVSRAEISCLGGISKPTASLALQPLLVIRRGPHAARPPGHGRERHQPGAVGERWRGMARGGEHAGVPSVGTTLGAVAAGRQERSTDIALVVLGGGVGVNADLLLGPIRVSSPAGYRIRRRQLFANRNEMRA